MLPSTDDVVYFAHAPYLGTKRVMDIVLALPLLFLTAPLILVCAIFVRLTSRGPAFTIRVRAGLFGQPFRFWKLRTTTWREDDHRATPRRVVGNDLGVTMFGRLLRRTHFDDLPQLWNVVRGDMSLIGPQPEAPEFIPLFEASIPRFRQRMLVRPGMTGLAQVCLTPDTTISGVQRQVQFDLYYIRAMAMTLDLRLLLAAALRIMGLPSRLACAAALLPPALEIAGPPTPENSTADHSSRVDVGAALLHESPPKMPA